MAEIVCVSVLKLAIENIHNQIERFLTINHEDNLPF